MVTRLELKKYLQKKEKQNELMEDRIKLIGLQSQIIQDAIRSLVYFRVIDQLLVGDRFWVATKSAHMQKFVTCFCMCFGSSREDTHWRKTVSIKSEFRISLFTSLGVNAREFKVYAKKLMTLRNKYFSHADSSVDSVHIPSFDLALESLKVLYKWLIVEIESLPGLVLPGGPLSIDEWINNLEIEIRPIIEVACEATGSFDQYQ